LPSVSRLLAAKELASWPHAIAAEAARQAISEARSAANGAGVPDIVERAVAIAQERARLDIARVVNCSGTILNTGLGRARLATRAVEAVQAALTGHSSLELDLESGGRGDRCRAIEQLLCLLTGAEAAHIVNNNAAAVALAVNTFACGREVLLSRGQSVEIGGAFRMPDIVRAAGARLVDVGCTNRTRVSDYSLAATQDTGAILRCHPSNFAMSGFVEEPSLADLAATAKSLGLVLVDDVGSGCLVATEEFGLVHEPTLAESLAAGADIVTASGDKLLGGPQAGIILGKRDLIAKLESNPLARAVRIDKATRAALEATLRLYVEGRHLEIPTLKYLSLRPESVRRTAQLLKRRLAKNGIACVIEQGTCEPGGGSLPGQTLASYRVGLDSMPPDDLARELRRGKNPVIGYIEKGRFWLDLRTVELDEVGIIVDSVIKAVAR
jgi:L-seryl-tRNA(Ser) seleniumtransferase